MSDEYPKHIEVDGITIRAVDAEDEARWRAAPVAPVAVLPALEPEPEPVSPLDDVIVEMDNPAFDPPKKKAAKKK